MTGQHSVEASTAEAPGFLNLGDFIRHYSGHSQFAIIDTREDEPRYWTFGQLRQAGEDLARGLTATGELQRGDRVAILAENSPEYLCAISAVMQAGLTAVPVNLRLPQETIDYILADSHCRLVFIDRDRPCNERIGPPKIRLYGDGPDSMVEMMSRGARSGAGLPARVAPEEWACILYTSGSTGRPKGVILTHGGQTWALSRLLKNLGALGSAGGRMLITAPFYHMNGLFFAMSCVASGVPFVLMPRFEAPAYIRLLKRHPCNVLPGIPTMFAMIVRERALLQGADFSFVREIILGSAPLSEKLVNDVRAVFTGTHIRNGFGTTEGGGVVFGPHPDGLAMPTLSVGCVAPGVEVELVDGASSDVGTLRMRSPALMSGYLNLPDETRKRLRDGWYYTGDVMRRDEHGFFYHIGRADDMFVCGGENLYPSQIEALLERHPQIAQAAVVPVPDEVKGQIPVAFIVRRSGSKLGERDVKDFALREGPAFSHPRHVRFLDALPVATSYKYDRRSLLEQALQVAAGRSA